MKKIFALLLVSLPLLITLACNDETVTELGWTNGNDSASIQDITWGESDDAVADVLWEETVIADSDSTKQEVGITEGYVNCLYDDGEAFEEADVELEDGTNSLALAEGSSTFYTIVAETAKK